MTLYTEENIDMFPFQEKELQATFYKSTDQETKAVILYFHGGGFIFGHRKDLPKSYIELFTSFGISVLTVDYPLAPETKLPTILDTTNKITNWFIDHFLPEINQTNYFIMGRSAGAFLALSNALYANQLAISPLGVVFLYGYFNLNDASFSVPNRHYLQYPKVEDKIVASLIEKEPFLGTEDPNRYLVYLAARQKGDWLDLFLSSADQKQKFTIQKDELKDLPPLFIAAASGDPDVPVRQSRQLANFHPKAMLNIFEVDEHDFDRVHESTIGLKLYKEIISWILEHLT